MSIVLSGPYLPTQVLCRPRRSPGNGLQSKREFFVKIAREPCGDVLCKAEDSKKDYGVFIEVDKIIVDAHNSVHRVAFNRAFQELGYRSIQWSPEVFWQLVRSAAATPVSLVQTYFNTSSFKKSRIALVALKHLMGHSSFSSAALKSSGTAIGITIAARLGWPSNVEKSQRQQLVDDIQTRKNAALDRMVLEGDISLRTGVQAFLQATLNEGANVSLITSTCSDPSERLVDAALDLIGADIQTKLKIFQCPQGPPPSIDANDDGQQTLEQKLRIETEKRRRNAAETLIDTVNRQKLGADWQENAKANEPGQLAQRPVGEGIIIDPSLLVGRERFASLSPAWLTACCATTGIPLQRTALLSGTNALLSAGRGCGLFSVAVPSKYSARGTYPYADAVMDSFGHGGGVTWSWLSRKIDAGCAGQNRKRRGRR